MKFRRATHQAFHLTLVIALAGAAITILEEVMGLQSTERSGPLSCAIWQNVCHQAPVIVIQDRLGDAAEDGEGPIVPVQPGFRRRRRVAHYEASIAVGKIHDKEMRPPLNAGDDHIRYTKISLGMARGM
jgi:hypothetical protein